MRACILIQSIRQSIQLVPEPFLSLSLSLSLPPPLFLSLFLALSYLSICLSIYPFAIVCFFRAWILHVASIDLQNDLSRARSTRSPLPRVPRESREFPETCDSLVRTSRREIRKEIRARSRPTARNRRSRDRMEAVAGPLPGEADNPRCWTPRSYARLLA